MVFSAHPDDAEMAMGGTLLKLSRSGLKIHHVCLTRGEMGTHGDVDTRAREFETACSLAGCIGEMWDLPDTAVENTPAQRIRVARAIRQYRPKIVFCPYHTNPLGELGGIANVDHYASGSLVRDGVKMARLDKTVGEFPKHTIHKLYFYMLPRDIRPRIYVDVSDVIDDTVALIECYKSQMAIGFSGRPIQDLLLVRRAAAGLDIGSQYAEGFTTDLPLVLQPRHFIDL